MKKNRTFRKKEHLEKKRTFRKKRGANNGRLNRHINSTHKMKGGGRRLAQLRQRINDIVRRFRGQPQQRDDASSPPPLPPSPVIGVRISRQIVPGFPSISETHFRILQDRVERMADYSPSQIVTPSELFLHDVRILLHRIDEMRRRLEPIINETTIPETTRETIIRDFNDDTDSALSSWIEFGRFLHTMKRIYDALRKAYRTAGLVEVQVKESENVPFSPSSSSRSSSSKSPEQHPSSRSSSSRTPEQHPSTRSLSRKSHRRPSPLPPPPPPSSPELERTGSTKSRAKSRAKKEHDWRTITALSKSNIKK